MKQWRVFVTPTAEKLTKTLPFRARDFILKEFPGLVKKNPFAGSQLSGPLSRFRSFHFSSEGKPYRIAYSIDQNVSEIIVHYVGYRGNFYERLRRYVGR